MVNRMKKIITLNYEPSSEEIHLYKNCVVETPSNTFCYDKDGHLSGAGFKETREDKLALTQVNKIQKIIERFGSIDGSHHKMWVIDQIMRIIKGVKYTEWVKEICFGDYDWDEGIAP